MARKGGDNVPRVRIKRKDYKISDFSKWIAGKMLENGMNQTEMGALIGISQPAFQNRLKKGLFSYDDVLTLFEKLKATDEEILSLMKL